MYTYIIISNAFICDNEVDNVGSLDLAITIVVVVRCNEFVTNVHITHVNFLPPNSCLMLNQIAPFECFLGIHMIMVSCMSIQLLESLP